MAAALRNTEEVQQRYQELRNNEQSLMQKLSDMAGQEAEHRLVIETLRPLEGDRKCYHLISGVLVERTVKEMLPTVEHNRDAMNHIILTYRESLQKVSAERAELQKTYQISHVPQEMARKMQRQQQQLEEGSAAGRGVLA